MKEFIIELLRIIAAPLLAYLKGRSDAQGAEEKRMAEDAKIYAEILARRPHTRADIIDRLHKWQADTAKSESQQ